MRALNQHLLYYYSSQLLLQSNYLMINYNIAPLLLLLFCQYSCIIYQLMNFINSNILFKLYLQFFFYSVLFLNFPCYLQSFHLKLTTSFIQNFNDHLIIYSRQIMQFDIYYCSQNFRAFQIYFIIPYYMFLLLIYLDIYVLLIYFTY